jgi:hypothetical protein
VPVRHRQIRISTDLVPDFVDAVLVIVVTTTAVTSKTLTPSRAAPLLAGLNMYISKVCCPVPVNLVPHTRPANLNEHRVDA